MSNTNIKLNILLDILKEKYELLVIISNICENQNTVLKSKNKTKETLSLFEELAQEKQVKINKVLDLDTAFSANYDSIENVLENSNLQNELKLIIKEIQSYILKVENESQNITNLEKQNDLCIVEIKQKSLVHNSKSQLKNIRKYNQNI